MDETTIIVNTLLYLSLYYLVNDLVHLPNPTISLHLGYLELAGKNEYEVDFLVDDLDWKVENFSSPKENQVLFIDYIMERYKGI